MGFDTKYRPVRYEEVLGQQATIQICREIIREGKNFHQSYVFAGPWGGGKTTVARIFARALLCEQPVDGEPCDACSSCLSMLSDRSESYTEVDAATNSSKEDIKRITEEAMFGSFSGRRKIYLMDESHGLSKQSMDALLKPMEDEIRGSQEKQLVAIFCTTEPEKMRNAIISRCAPIFRIRLNTPAEIAARLDYICEKEEIEREQDALLLIAEVTECHVRDAIKAVEGVSMLGRIDRTNVISYLNLDANTLLLDLLESVGFDQQSLLRSVGRLSEKVAPSTCYERLADLSMLLYRLVVLGNVTIPSYWDRDRMTAVGERHREYLVTFAERFAKRPSHATYAMLNCDAVSLHQLRANITVRVQAPEVPAYVAAPQPLPPQPQAAQLPIDQSGSIAPTPTTETVPVGGQTSVRLEKAAVNVGSMRTEPSPIVTETGVYLAPLAQKQHRSPEPLSTGASTDISAAFFREVLRRRIEELTEERSHGRPARRHNLGSS